MICAIYFLNLRWRGPTVNPDPDIRQEERKNPQYSTVVAPRQHQILNHLLNNSIFLIMLRRPLTVPSSLYSHTTR